MSLLYCRWEVFSSCFCLCRGKVLGLELSFWRWFWMIFLFIILLFHAFCVEVWIHDHPIANFSPFFQEERWLNCRFLSDFFHCAWSILWWKMRERGIPHPIFCFIFAHIHGKATVWSWFPSCPIWEILLTIKF